MKKFVSGVPIPLAGVALGFTALGNLLNVYSPTIRTICGIVAAALLFLVLSKIILCFKQVREEFKNPIIASVSATIFMTIMQLSTYIAPLNIPNIEKISLVIWSFALILHIALIIYFTLRLFFELKLHHLYPTCFVTYVGIIIAAITSPTFGLEALGKIIFYIGFFFYILIFVLISYRYMRHEIEEPSRPLFVIYAAPMSLSLTGYLAVMDVPNQWFIVVLMVLAQILYLVVLFQLPNLLKLPFYPSYAAFTFPMVITPFALQKVLGVLATTYNWQIPGSVVLLLILETSIAVGMVLYAFYHYMIFFKKHYNENCKNCQCVEA